MNPRLTLHVLGGLLLSLAVALLLPVAFSLYFGDGSAVTFLLSSSLAGIVGGALYFGLKTRDEIGLREGFAIVSFGWMAFGLFGALPYIISGQIPTAVDALFESVSGFTTTGATILPEISRLTPSMLFWRSLTQWLGGMGIIVLTLAILPMLGVGGMQLFRAEVPGPTQDRLTPRIQDTAKLLWEVYFALTAALVILLAVGEMNWFEALCHGLTTMATGGFSTSDQSVGGWQSPWTHWVITLFMFLAGTNFSLHYLLFRGKFRSLTRSEEFRVYVGINLTAIVVITACLLPDYDSPLLAFQHTAFQVVSISTSTGFGTADYEQWPLFVQAVIMGLMLVGGMAGSTGGGMKVARVLLLVKHAGHQVFRLIHPRGIRILKLSGKAVNNDVIQSILGFGALYFFTAFLATAVMAADGTDLLTGASAAISALSNIGPGLGSVGPTENYAHLGTVTKLVLAWCMVLGRLELFTVLVLFFPSFWRK